MRNRLHIQNKNFKLDKDEIKIFTDLNLSKSEKVLKTVLLKMSTKFPRRNITQSTRLAALNTIEQMITSEVQKARANISSLPHPYISIHLSLKTVPIVCLV